MPNQHPENIPEDVSIPLESSMAEHVTSTSEDLPQESAQTMSHSGQGVVGSPTSLAENLDTAISSTVDPPPHNTEYRNVAGADRYETARRKRVLEEGDRASTTKLNAKKGNYSRTSVGASRRFIETPESECSRTFYHRELTRDRTFCRAELRRRTFYRSVLNRPITCRPAAGARKNVASLPIKKRKYMHAPAGETEPGHHIVEQEVTVPPPPQQVPVQPQVFPGPCGTQLPHSLIEDRVSTSEPSSDSDETEQSQARDPVMVVDLTQELDNEILDSVQHPAVSTAPAASPTASHLIPYSPLPQVVPPLVSPSRQNQCSSSEPAEVPSAPQPTADHVRRERMLRIQQLVQATRRRRIDTPAMVRWMDYSRQPPVAPCLRHHYGLHHHRQPPVSTRHQLMQAAERRRTDTPAMVRQVDYSRQPPFAPCLRHHYGLHHYHQPPVPTRQQPMQAAERRTDTPAMVRRVDYSRQPPVAPCLRHHYGTHHYHQPPVPTRQQLMQAAERRTDTPAMVRPVDYSRQPPVPTPPQPTAYSHPEGRSAISCLLW
ncbi:hypothetical protein L9F63_026732 [Diploptera punctata]|uniref:Uncharacterized protein n=1 Tax=Diploptera punctata TaxID=6984 RepID=A0AAD8EPU6_DIPPU|nr:hypothetical protein L9F63_026732 [Diploptera punctata]